MALLDLLDNLTFTAEAAVLALYARYEAGELEEAMFLALAAAVINAASARATVVADLALAADLRDQLGRLVRPLGIRPAPSQDRLRAAIQTVLDMDAKTPDEGLRFLAQSEIVGAAQATAGEVMRRHRVGWVRGLSGGACPLCTSWADGRVRSPRITMIRHHGCRCMPRPVTREIQQKEPTNE